MTTTHARRIDGAAPSGFYAGAVLTVDLTFGTTSVAPLNLQWAEQYIGGKGLLLRYLWDLVPTNVAPWSPDNPIVLMTGPLAGTGACTGSRLVVGCKSPVTGVLNDSYVGGSFAPELKFAGYDAVVITGQSPSPVVVTIKDDVVALVPGEDYWGMVTSEIEAALRADFDKRAKVLSIGPAGESQIPWACISTDQYHKAGRGGHGALMGRKKLKAVAVRGTGSVKVGDARAFLSHLLDLQTQFMDGNLWLTEEGTAILVDPINGGGVMPTRNWSSGSFAGADRINSAAFTAVRTGRRACSQCSMACRQWHQVPGVAGEGPEYETIALCGPNCGVGDIPALMKFNAECDEWGLDTMSMGVVLGLAMDLTEKGIHDYGVRFGELDSYVKVPGLVARREGIGADLALGARALAASHGHPELAMEVKNLELPGYDPRGSYGMSLAYATSDRGACHMRSYTVGAEVLSGTMPPDSLEGKAALVVYKQNYTSLYYSGIWCGNFGLSIEAVGGLLERVWGRAFSETDLLEIGERIWNLGRLFNVREAAEPDTTPAMTVEPAYAFKEGVAAGRSIGADVFEAALQEVYALRDWDAAGVPSEAKLVELGIDVRL